MRMNALAIPFPTPAKLAHYLPERPGVAIDTDIARFIQNGIVTLAAGAPAITAKQIQPASLDLRLGARAWRVQASILPGPGQTVDKAIQPLVMAEVDLSQPQLLERGGVYVVELLEGVALPAALCAAVSPKSSTGRLDLFVRLLHDGASTYDCISAGYTGKLYVELMPLTFSIILRAGQALNQLRFRYGSTFLSDTDLNAEQATLPLVIHPDEPEGTPHTAEGLWTSVDLMGYGPEHAQNRSGERGPIVGYRAKHHTQPIDLARIGQYDWRHFWDAIYRNDITPESPLILYPGAFYILVSRERMCVPPHLTAELMAYDTRVGELRLHYAGFFDPGFGYDPTGQSHGTPGVLEVRAHDVPCVLHHGQRIGRFVYERTTGTPGSLYGQGIGSNYAGQALKLAKQFK